MSFLVKSLKVGLLFLVGFPFFSSPVLARTLVQDGIKLPLVAADNQIDSQVQGRVLVNTAGEGTVLPGPPSALEIIRSRNLWQEETGLDQEDSLSPSGFDNLLEDSLDFPDLDTLVPTSLPAGSTFTNPAEVLDDRLSEEEVKDLINSSLEEFTSSPVSFLEALEVLGASSLAATSVSGPLTQDGTLMLTEGRNIDVVGDALRLQSEGLGAIDFIAGKMKLDREGNLVVSGRLSVGGGIEADFLSPLASDTVTVGQNLVVEGVATVGDLHSQGEVKGRSLTVTEETNLAGPVTIQNSPLTIGGSLTASDYARVGDLIIDRGLKILDQGQSGSAGTATIYAGTHQVVIANTRVNEKSRIFLTADFGSPGEIGFQRGVSLYDSPTLFISQKLPGSHFVVAVDQLLEEDLTFNWLMVN